MQTKRYEYPKNTAGLARRPTAGAWELQQQGWKQWGTVAALGVTPEDVGQWLRRAALKELRCYLAKAPTPKLATAQLSQLPSLLMPGAEAYSGTQKS
jgi:hypothetical protein